MKNNFVRILTLSALVLPLLISQKTWALFEARATYGLLTSKQDVQDLCAGYCSAPANAPGIVPTYGMGFDALVKLPLVPFGFGLRMENQALTAESSTITAEAKWSRTAVLVNYRLIDTIVHIGPIASFGISHSGSFSLKENGATKADLTPGSMSSYSLGLEAGIKPLIIVPIVVGAEAGYMGFNWKDAKNSLDNTTKNIDMSGTYFKIFIGLDI